MTSFEQDVIDRLARIETRTESIDHISADVTDLKSKVRLLEFKAGLFGTIAGACVVVANRFLGKT